MTNTITDNLKFKVLDYKIYYYNKLDKYFTYDIKNLPKKFKNVHTFYNLIKKLSSPYYTNETDKLIIFYIKNMLNYLDSLKFTLKMWKKINSRLNKYLKGSFFESLKEDIMLKLNCSQLYYLLEIINETMDANFEYLLQFVDKDFINDIYKQYRIRLYQLNKDLITSYAGFYQLNECINEDFIAVNSSSDFNVKLNSQNDYMCEELLSIYFKNGSIKDLSDIKIIACIDYLKSITNLQ